MLNSLYPKYYLDFAARNGGGGGEEEGGGSDEGGSDVPLPADTIQKLSDDDNIVVIWPSKTDTIPKKVEEVTIGLIPIQQIETNRPLVVRGTEGAKFDIFFKQKDASNNYLYYNFNTQVWGLPHSTLITIPTEGVYTNIVRFPKTTVNNEYHFEVVPTGDTTVSIGGNPKFYKSQTIYQYIDTDATFSLATAESDFTTLPSNVVLSNLRGVVGEDVSLSWDVSISANEFIVDRQPTINDFKTSRSDIYITSAAGSSSTSLRLDDISNLVPGLALTDIQSGSVSGSPVISFINVETNVLTLSVAQSWAVGKTITFTGYGPVGFALYNTMIATKEISVALDDVTTTTTAAVSASTTVPVASTNGIGIDTAQTVDGATSASTEVVLDSVANLRIGQTLVNVSSGTLDGIPTITEINDGTKALTLSSAQTFPDPCTIKFANSLVSGIGIDSSTTDPYVDSISSLDLTLSAAQTLESGVTLTFTGSSRNATVEAEIKVIKLGNDNFTTTLQLDNFLTII